MVLCIIFGIHCMKRRDSCLAHSRKIKEPKSHCSKKPVWNLQISRSMVCPRAYWTDPSFTLQGNNGDSITLPRYLLWRQSLYHADLCNVLCSRSHSTSYCHTGTNFSKMARNEPCQQGGAQKYSSQVLLRSSHNSDAISVVARDYK